MPSCSSITPSCSSITPSCSSITPSCSSITPSCSSITPSCSSITPSCSSITPSCSRWYIEEERHLALSGYIEASHLALYSHAHPQSRIHKVVTRPSWVGVANLPILLGPARRSAVSARFDEYYLGLAKKSNKVIRWCW